MSNHWKSYEGLLFNNKYPLHLCLSDEGDAAIFRTEYGPNRAPAILKLFNIAPENRASLLNQLLTASSVSHPHLLQIVDYGEGEVDFEPFVFLIAENTEGSLAEVLADRALTPDETREVTKATAGALAYLHDASLVHGALEPVRIYAVGEQIKILSDSILKSGVDDSRNFAVGRYSAPELCAGTVSPAADVWSMGLITLQCLTGQQPRASSEQQVESLPLRFRQIVKNSLKPNAEERWSAAQVGFAVSNGADQPQTEVGKPSVQKIVGLNRLGVKAGIAAAAVLVVVAGWQVRQINTKPREAVITVDAVQSSAPSSQAPRAQSVPTQNEGIRNRITHTVVPEKGNQFVIVATYNRVEDARREAKSVNERWPKFKADVESPHHPHPPYLVTIGANLSKAAALRIQKEALRAGLPRDTYVQSF